MTILHKLTLNLIFTVFVVSALRIVEQLDLKLEPQMEDLEKYLEDYVSNKPFALLLDYDGTLAAIQPHPNMTYMTEYTKEALLNISSYPNVYLAVISGRGVDDVKTKVGIDGIVYAGNHGLEILYPNGTRYIHEVPSDVKANFTKMVEALENLKRDGSWVENKKFSVTFHFRAVPEKDHEKINNEAKEIIEKFGYRANPAHCAIEAKPPVVWHKGKAAEYILNHSFGKDWREKIQVVFAGDDTTDEDVFELLQGIGVTFRVTKDPNIVTKATYKVPSTEAVTKVLQWVDKKFGNK
ncbi:hypothetical protein PVAND_013302 [Polypedilum vanderplanki]|uniref:Trehalose 6-phosphate phosphatase n=1 Tax=Polypedilum vanderplanki TaxID=319348 RepID=A0A9J6CR44_POLVA|nr:hypothetical protein PVAND_013302 [Polypedilum vanderplanki]